MSDLKAACIALGKVHLHTRRPAITLLIKIVGKVVENPLEAKFRALSLSAKVVKRDLEGVQGAIETLEALGFAKQRTPSPSPS